MEIGHILGVQQNPVRILNGHRLSPLPGRLRQLPRLDPATGRGLAGSLRRAPPEELHR